MENSAKSVNFQVKELKVCKKVVSDGSWGDRPFPIGAVCMVDISLLREIGNVLPNEYLHDGKQKIITGDAKHSVDRAVEQLLCHMLDGETCSIVIATEDTRISFHLNLMEKVNPLPLLDWPEYKVTNLANHYKQKGVQLFQDEMFASSFDCFSKGLKILILTDATSAEALMLKANLCTNMAACHLQKNNYEKTTEMCEKALSIQPENRKALYRLGVSAFHVKEYQKANECILHLLKLEPKNRQALEFLKKIKDAVKEIDEEYKEMARRMLQL